MGISQWWNNNMGGGDSTASANVAVNNQANGVGTSYNSQSTPITNGFNSPQEYQHHNNLQSQTGGWQNNLGMVVGGVQALGSLWNSYQQQKIAKESMEFQKDAFKTNLRNQTQTYNTALEDRIRNRYEFSADKTSADADAYIAKNKL